MLVFEEDMRHHIIERGTKLDKTSSALTEAYTALNLSNVFDSALIPSRYSSMKFKFQDVLPSVTIYSLLCTGNLSTLATVINSKLGAILNVNLS